MNKGALMFSEKSLNAPDKLVILCASYFDRLGHPIFANKIKAELTGQFGCRIEIRGIATASYNFSISSSPGIEPISVCCGYFNTIDARSALKLQYGLIGTLISWCVRFVSVTHFYLRTFRTLKHGVRVIDLECEPVQALLASFIVMLHPDVRISYVIHSMPRQFRSILMSAYKSLSAAAINVLVRAPGRRAIFMNSAALETAVSKGIAREKCILGGWGFDVRELPLVMTNRPLGDRTIVLAFGVLRKDKQLTQLVDCFLDLDDPFLLLRIVGKSVDVDVSKLRQQIIDSPSRTAIEISDSYVEEDKIGEVFKDCHMVVLSHSAVFESMSGPMFLAIEFDRPILCFSGHTVASLVQESGSGVVLRLDDDRVAIRTAIAELRSWRYDPAKLRKYTWRAIATRMVTGI
jgi:hypothetical protein